MARKINSMYPDNCSDCEDYIQIGHMVLAKIRKNPNSGIINNKSYAITAIANTMRNAALDNMFSVSAPREIKKKAHKIRSMTKGGSSDEEICDELNLNQLELDEIRTIISINLYKDQLSQISNEFCLLSDILSCESLTQTEVDIILEQFDIKEGASDMSRNQKYGSKKKIRSKLSRGGYGIGR